MRSTVIDHFGGGNLYVSYDYVYNIHMIASIVNIAFIEWLSYDKMFRVFIYTKCK